MHNMNAEDPMAEERHDDNVTRRYDETNHPQNPPNSVLNRDARRATVWSYFVPIVVLFVVIGVALVYWSNRPEHSQAESAQRPEVGTVGSDQGGFDPAPRPGDTDAEIDRRGDDLAPITSLGSLEDIDARTMNGRRVVLSDVTVDAAEDGRFWVRSGDERYAVVAPDGTAAVRTGARVDVSGRVESTGVESWRILADRVQPHQ
jgi:hypothetical protein